MRIKQLHFKIQRHRHGARYSQSTKEDSQVTEALPRRHRLRSSLPRAWLMRGRFPPERSVARHLSGSQSAQRWPLRLRRPRLPRSTSLVLSQKKPSGFSSMRQHWWERSANKAASHSSKKDCLAIRRSWMTSSRHRTLGRSKEPAKIVK